MRLMGAAAIAAEPITHAMDEAAFAGRPAFVWCDGEDVTAVIGEDGDSVEDVLRMVARCVPGVVA